MRMYAWLLVMAIAVFGSQRGYYATPNVVEVGVYRTFMRQTFEQPLFRVGRDDRLLILETRGDKLLVRDRMEREGWVEKRLVRRIGSAAVMSFDKAEVYGYLEAPQPILILDPDQREDSPILLDRSFRDDLRRNVDREQIQRRAP